MNKDRWNRAVRRFLLPRLDGRWETGGHLIVRGEVGWTVRRITPRLVSGYPRIIRVEAAVQLLAVPDPDGYHCCLMLDGRWDEPGSVAGYEPLMADLSHLIKEEAVPFLDGYGSLDGYLTYLRWRVDGAAGSGVDVDDLHVAEELTYLYLIRGDRARAVEAGEYVESCAVQLGRKWSPSPSGVSAVVQRVRHVLTADRRDHEAARSILAATATATAVVLGLSVPRRDRGALDPSMPSRTDVNEASPVT